MKMLAVIRAIALVLGMGLAASAWAGGHWHDGLSAHPADGKRGHEPAPRAPFAPAPYGGGTWHSAPPDRGTQFAGGDRWHHHGGGHDWDHHRDHDWDHDWHHDWGHGDIRYFYYYDWDAWGGGYWHHGWYGPRFGWWWVVSGVWFFYPVPVYPYPNPYLPSDWAAPPPPVGAPAPAADQFWYFCPASNAYYPYVPTCPSGWQQVPANADPAPQPPNPPPPGG